jgi:lysophospholipase L1-like esterase
MMMRARSRPLKKAALVATTCLLIALGAAAQAASQTSPTPYPKQPADWPGEGVVRVFDYMNQNRAYFWTQLDKKQGSVVFAGDSLTGGWRNLEQAFPGLSVANRGVGGDVSRGLLFRFKEDVLALNPTGIVLLIGSADLSTGQANSITVGNLALMLKMARAYSAHVPIVLCTIPPRNNPQAPVPAQQIADLNQRIKQLATQFEHVAVLDLFPLLAKDDGSINELYFNADRLHLNEAGYRVWLSAIKPLFDKLPLMQPAA